ncbi:MAG: hypothetical protein A2W91_07145 [Bacteroidetes bacterium GWF2_38_335]|nr:MAG: hypothetical protein A2W91_07145 [Bacteroidetes bacterium GWF2_38_335]OFY77104.1 MAG: hypothetical protein A2281_14380 [Bacteroidetes bacterium RIFOXYA12_FULL_38_20]HBS84994.1 hypothetical protein [Bacteroidales bacterium]
MAKPRQSQSRQKETAKITTNGGIKGLNWAWGEKVLFVFFVLVCSFCSKGSFCFFCPENEIFEDARLWSAFEGFL